MPSICESPISINNKITENLCQTFKRSEKENNYEIHSTPTVKQVLSTKIEYEEVPSYANTTLNSLQAKYIVLKPNQQPLNVANNLKAHHNDYSEKNGSSSTSSSSSTTPSRLPQPKKVLFPKERILIGWNGHSFGRSWSAGVGFNNIGNTCYLNSALQAFFHVPAIAHWLMSDKDHSCKESNSTCIICAMSTTLMGTQKNSGSFTPSNITHRLSQICKHLTLGRQEDSHEFLRYLIEKMEKSFLNRYRHEPWFKDLDQFSKETTPINQILGGYLRSTVTCLSCNHDSITFQHFQDLPLDISRSNTLTDAIQGYFSRENLEECGYKCESCKKRVSAAKKFSLERAPVVLCIQLKRFTAMGGKLSKSIQIFEKLNLQKYLSKTSDQNQNCSYKLVSMVTHLGGSANGGHYTAIGMAPNGNYYLFDDSRVSYLSQQDALRSNAYVLFYELIQQTEHSNNHVHNGHSIFHENGHTYSKNGSEIANGNGNASSAIQFGKIRENDSSFSKPNLPKMIVPSNVLKNQRQKENELTSPEAKNMNRPQNILNGKTIHVSLKTNNNNSNNNNHHSSSNGVKRELTDNDEENSENHGMKKPKIEKSTLPSLPRLSDEHNDDSLKLLKTPTKQTSPSFSKDCIKPSPTLPLNILCTPPSTPTKQFKLVPYDTDDDEDDESTTTKNADKKTNLCRTSSGVFIETDFKENCKGPSKHGSTIQTKASTSVNGEQEKPTNGSVKRTEDVVQQLSKHSHSGYGTSEVKSWKSAPTSMNKEVEKDQSDERKRQHEEDGDMEMDRGRTKKVKYFSSQGSYGHVQHQNPFQEYQNKYNNNGQNGSDRYMNDWPRHSHRSNYHNNNKKYHGHNNHGPNRQHYRQHNNNGNNRNNNQQRYFPPQNYNYSKH